MAGTLTERITRITRAASACVQAWGELQTLGLQHAARRTMWKGLAGTLVLAAVVLGLIAGGLAVEPYLGAPLTLAAEAVVLAGAGLIIGWAGPRAGRARLHADERHLRVKLDSAVAELTAALKVLDDEVPADETDAEGTARTGGTPDGATLERALRLLTGNPKTVAAAFFAAASVIGPLRAVRTAAKVASFLATARTVVKGVTDAIDADGSAAKRNGQRAARRW